MKKLRIIDETNVDANQWDVLLQFEDGNTFVTEHCVINPDDFFCKKDALNWYYSEYLLQPLGHNYKKAQQIASNMINNGKSLSNQLFTEKIMSILDNKHVHDMVITVESSSEDFLRFPWETLHLSNHMKPLSTLVPAFVRGNYADVPKQFAFGTDNPLTILFISPRPSDCIDNPLCSIPDFIIRSLIELGDAVKIETLSGQHFSELAERLEKSSENPIHLLHFNGYIANKSDECNTESVIFESKDGSADFVSCKQFSDLLNKHGVDTVFMDVAAFLRDNQMNADSHISTRLAQIMLSSGVTNVITTLFGHYSVYAQRFYSILLSLLASGNSLSVSVVKARSVMLENSSQSVLTIQDVNFIDWTLITHYSAQDITFFSEPLALKPIGESQHYQDMLKNIVGFDQEILARGFLGRAHEDRAIDRILERNTIALVAGNNGVGKTHFVHHYMLWNLYTKKSIKALYFDFRSHVYTKKSLLEIIFDVLGDKSLDIDGVEKIIQEQNYLFVFDNIDAACFLNTSDKEELFRYLEVVSKGASSVIVISTDAGIENANNNSTLYLKGLNAYDRRQFICSLLRQRKCVEAEEIPGYFDLIDSLDGHPFISEILLPFIAEHDPEDIKKVFFEKLKKLTNSDDIYSSGAILALFEYGWKYSSINFQKIFLAFKNYNGYITEGMIVSADRKAQQSNKAELYALLNIDTDYPLATAFAQACKIGLYRKKEFGYEIHPQAKSFLNMEQNDHLLNEGIDAAIEMAVSKLFVAELQMLFAFVKQHQDKKLYQIIIQNNSRWFDALALLWKEHVYNVFLQGIDFLLHLMSILGLRPIFESWAFALIKQQPFHVNEFAANKEYSIAWLKIAASALGVTDAAYDGEISSYADEWQKALVQEEDVDIFDSTMMFLETFYRKKGDWQARKSLSEQAVIFYKKISAYEKVIVSMRSLAKCEEALGNLEQAKIVENKIITDIPFENIHPGAKQEAMLSIAMNQVQRKEYKEAEILINDIKAMPDSDSYHFIADTMRADIFSKNEQYSESVKAYACLWKEILHGEHKHIGQKENILIATRLKQLAKILGDETFMRDFKEIAPDVKTPMELEAERLDA